jgi:trans-aconitate methyltransferase
MTQWSDGYVSDIPYSAGFYSKQMPSLLDSVLLVRGIEPPVASGTPFTYCELGCGMGETAMVVAATYPQAQVWAFDFMPGHIARAQMVARSCGLDNLHIEERSFAQLTAPDAPEMPLFDYVTVHGVWSWVAPEHQNHIVRFLERHVRPGGLVYVTYNAMPAWSERVSLQRLLRVAASLDPRRSDLKILRALGFAEQVAKAGGYVQAAAVERLQKIKIANSGTTTYLAHEYLNEHWKPVYQIEVAAALAEAKLEYVASAEMVENFPKICLTGEQLAIVDQVPAHLREFMQDYFMPRPLRQDVFVRGSRPIFDRRRMARLRQQRLTCVEPPSAVRFEVDVPLGKAGLHQRFYGPAFKALGEGIVTVGDLIDLPEAKGHSATPEEVLGMTIASHQVLPAPNDTTASALARVRAFNIAHIRVCADEGHTAIVLAGAAIGSAVSINLREALGYEVLATGAAPDVESMSQAALSLLKERGDRLRHEDKDIDDDGETLKILRTYFDKLLTGALPIWRRIGAI